MNLANVTVRLSNTERATADPGMVVVEEHREPSGLIVQRLATPVVAAAERRALQFSRGREFVPAGVSKAKAAEIQKTGAHDTVIASVEMQLNELAAEKSPVVKSARRRELLAKIDATKSLSDKEKLALRTRVEQAG